MKHKTMGSIYILCAETVNDRASVKCLKKPINYPGYKPNQTLNEEMALESEDWIYQLYNSMEELVAHHFEDLL